MKTIKQIKAEYDVLGAKAFDKEFWEALIAMETKNQNRTARKTK